MEAEAVDKDGAVLGPDSGEPEGLVWRRKLWYVGTASGIVAALNCMGVWRSSRLHFIGHHVRDANVLKVFGSQGLG